MRRVGILDDGDAAVNQVPKEFAARVAPIESQLGDFLLKAEYKTGKLLDSMKIDEIIAAVGEMNEVIQEVDPTEKIVEFEDSLSEMEVDLQITMAMSFTAVTLSERKRADSANIGTHADCEMARKTLTVLEVTREEGEW